MLFLNKIINVRSFVVLDDSLFCLESGKLTVYNSKFEFYIKLFDSTILFPMSKYVFSDENIYFDMDKRNICKIKELNGCYFSGIYNENILVFSSDKNIIYSLRDNKIVNSIDFFNNGSLHKIINNKYFVNGVDYYSLYDIYNNNKEWEIPISTLLNTNNEIIETGEIISYKDKIFIYLYDNGDKLATIVLDVETGNELFRTSDFKGYIRLQEDKIYALYDQSVSILDPETYQVRKIDLSEELAVLDESIEEFWGTESLGYTTIEFELSPTTYEVHYPYLYFIQDRGAKVGIVNLETEKLEWHAAMDIDYPANPVVKDIKAFENRVYIHCADNTLHVFERE